MNNHPTSITCWIVLISLWLVFIPSHDALANSPTRATKSEMVENGLRLTVTSDDSVTGKIVTCVLQNTTEVPFVYLSQGSTNGFIIRLYDRDRKEVRLIGRWTNFNGNAEVLSNVRQIIDPGGKLELTIPLKEAFGDNWKFGLLLEVGWDPGDAGFINPRFVGKTLRASITVGSGVPSHEPKPTTNDSPSVDPASRFTSPLKPTHVAKPLLPSEEPASSTPWSIIVVLIVAASCLLWWVLKRRS